MKTATVTAENTTYQVILFSGHCVTVKIGREEVAYGEWDSDARIVVYTKFQGLEYEALTVIDKAVGRLASGAQGCRP